MNKVLHPRLVMLFLLATILGLALSTPVLFSNLADDAYIHSRIVNNVLSHGQPYFNIDQKFKASSSTGYILILTALAGKTGVVEAIRYICFVSTFFFVIGIISLVSDKRNGALKKLFIFFGATAPVLWAAYSGMETVLACTFLVYAAIAYKMRAIYLAVFLISTASVFRFELNALLLIAIAMLFLKDRSAKVLICIVPSIFLIILEQFFFGEFVPNAAKAKSIGYNFPIFESILNNFRVGGGKTGSIAALLLAFTVVVRTWQSRNLFLSQNPLPVGFLWFSLIALIAWSISKSLVFQWYYCLAAVPYCIACSFDDNLNNEQRKNRIWRLNKISAYFVMGAFFALGAKGLVNHLSLTFSQNETDRVIHYMRIGNGLSLECPDCTLLTSEIGGLGYSFKGVVYDAFGLGDPEAIKFHPLKVPEERLGYGIGAIPPKYVEYRNPDFIVSMPVFSASFRNSTIISKYYTFDCIFDGKRVFGDDRIQVFSKRDIPQKLLDKMGCNTLDVDSKFEVQR